MHQPDDMADTYDVYDAYSFTSRPNRHAEESRHGRPPAFSPRRRRGRHAGLRRHHRGDHADAGHPAHRRPAGDAAHLVLERRVGDHRHAAGGRGLRAGRRTPRRPGGQAPHAARLLRPAHRGLGGLRALLVRRPDDRRPRTAGHGHGHGPARHRPAAGRRTAGAAQPLHRPGQRVHGHRRRPRSADRRGHRAVRQLACPVLGFGRSRHRGRRADLVPDP